MEQTAKPFRVHRPQLKIVARGLSQVFGEGRYAEPVLEKLLASEPKLGARDRRFISEVYFDLVRFWRHTQAMLQWLQLDEGKKTDYYLRVCLWVEHKGLTLPEDKDLPVWDKERLKIWSPEKESIAIKESLPDDLLQFGVSQLGDDFEKELHFLNRPAPIYLRTNTLKISRADLIEVLKDEGVECQAVEFAGDAIELLQRTNVVRLGSFRKGLYEVQDASSQLIGALVDPKPNMLVVDACAGAGGKSLHLAALMGNEGNLIAMDVEGWKLMELRKRASRNGIDIIETRTIESNRTWRDLEGRADRLLIDAPCSGMGVIRRHPDSKWHLNEASIKEVENIQYKILDSYSAMLKKGGLMVYATCSILPNENQKQVETFLKQHADFELLEEKQTWPSEGRDGFYMALIKRKG